jgi:hypothetical protein
MPPATQSTESGSAMDKVKNRGAGRSVRSTLGKVLSAGVCSALMATGVLLVTATAASAATAATQVAFTTQPPTAVTVGVAFANFSVTIEGSDGTPANNDASDVISITPSAGCTVTGASPVTASSNVATFSGVAITSTGACTLTAADTSNALTTDTVASNAMTSYATTATKLGFSVEPLSSTTAGATLTSFSVKVENGAGALASNGSADVIAITSACTLAGTTTATASSGVATFGALVIDGGTSPCTLIATDSTEALTTATSSGVTVTAGVPTKVIFTTEPTATVLQSAVLTSFKVSVEDAFGNVESSGTGATDTVTLTPSTGCTLGGTATGVAVAGVATFSALTITSTGACTLTATDSSRTLTTAASTAVDSQGAQAALVVSSVTGYLGSALTLATTGGSGTGAVTFVAVPGTALGCIVTGTSLTVTSLGTCTVTATKAASTTNLAVSSVATTVTFVVPPPKATKVDGVAVAGQTRTVIVVGANFFGRPKITSHTGTTVVVTKDTGRLLDAKVTVKAGERAGTYTFTIKFSNGKVTKVKYIQKA